MVNNSNKGKIFAIICTILIAFGCSSASNLLFGDFITFNELIPGETSKMALIEDNEFNPVYLVNHMVYTDKTTNKTTNKTNKTTNKTSIANKTTNYNKTTNTNKTSYNSSTLL